MLKCWILFVDLRVPDKLTSATKEKRPILPPSKAPVQQNASQDSDLSARYSRKVPFKKCKWFVPVTYVVFFLILNQECQGRKEREEGQRVTQSQP